jgi:transposase
LSKCSCISGSESFYKNNEIYGVDISKDVFNVFGSLTSYRQFKNSEVDFKAFAKALPKHTLVVMEAIGYYQYCLAQLLDENGIAISVANLLSVKRFIQRRLAKVKADKRDAKMFCEYGTIKEVPLYSALTNVQAECLQLFR